MAFRSPLRTLLELTAPATSRTVRARPKSSSVPPQAPCCHAFSTSAPKRQETAVDEQERPRWQQTPRAMMAPVRTRPKPAHDYVVNEDPQKLDRAYIRMLGNGGDKILTEETKWLAVTHKSFDHGRRGFNDRLAFLGASPPFRHCRPTLSLPNSG